MTAAGEFRSGRFVGPAQTKSVVVNIDKGAAGPWPAFRFPSPGYLQGAFIYAEFATSGTAMQAQLLNGGVSGAGTVISFNQTHGTTLAGSAYVMTINTAAGLGPEAYAEGELVMVKLAGGNPATDIQVQIDYSLDPNPAPTAAPTALPAA